MKKVIAVLLCLLVIPAQMALADNSALEGTVWELGLIMVIETEEIYTRDEIEAAGMMMTFEFRTNNVVVLTMPGGATTGEYLLSGYDIEMDFPEGYITTTINERDGVVMISFANTFEEGLIHLFVLRQGSGDSTPGGSTPDAPPPGDTTPGETQPDNAPPAPPIGPGPAPTPVPRSSGSGLPKWIQDWWWGALIGAVVGVVIHFFNKKKKNTAAADSAGSPMPLPYDPMQAAPVHSGAQPQLYCQSGPMAGATYPINGSLRIGRDPGQCQIVFPAETKGVSSLHCEVLQQPSGVLLTDHNSSFGTFLSSGRKLNANESVFLNTGESFYLADAGNTFKVV